MTTVARMMVEMGGDPSGLRRAFAESVRNAHQFATNLKHAVNAAPIIAHQKVVDEFKRAGEAAGRAFTKAVTDDLENAGGKLKSAGQTLAYSVTLPLIAFGGLATKAAANANESFNKFDVLFGKLGTNVGRELGNMHRTIPATTAQLKDMSSSFQSLLVPMGLSAEQAAKMSTRLTLLGGDLTSLHNIPVAETMQRLFSGLVGETEAVRRFGVDISEARLKVLALNAGMGGNVQALTRAQKTMLIYNEILRSTSVAHGDAAATAGSAANQFRFLQRDFQETSQTIGQRLLPVLVPLAKSLSEILARVAKLNPETIDAALKFGLLAAAVGPVLIVLGSTMTAMAHTATAVKALSAALAGKGAGLLAALTGPVGIAVALVAATVALIAWAQHAQNAKTDVDALALSFRGLNEAQLQARVTDEARRLTSLFQERDRLAKENTGRPGSKGEDAMGVAGGMGEINQKIREQQALLNGLGTEWSRLAGERAEYARNVARNEAMLAALNTGMANATAEALAAARAAAKEERTHMQALQARVSAISDLYNEAERFGQSTGRIESLAIETFRQVSREIDATGGRFDANTAKLLNLRMELQKIRAVASSPWGLLLPAITNVQPTSLPTAGQQAGSNVRGIGAQDLPRNVTAPPPRDDASALRFRLAMEDAGKAVRSFGSGVVNVVRSFGSGLLSILRGFGTEILGSLANSLRPVIEPLLPVFQQLAVIVAETLGPVMQALAPVIQALIPVIRGMLQVLAPILTALVPLFRAMVPLLNALFPIFKLLGIAATYIGQAFGIAANIVLRAVGNIIMGFGMIIKKIAEAVDALPFVSARGAIDAAQGIIDFGRGMLTAADEFKTMANDMAHAREEIKGVNLSTTDSVAQLGAAAANATEALLGVPSIFRLRARLVEQWPEGRPSGPTSAPFTPPQTPPLTGGPTSAPFAPPSGPAPFTPLGGEQHASKGGGGFVIHGDVVIQTSGDGSETLDNFQRAIERRALATSGVTTRPWNEAYQ